jgi:hypothetical protein
MEVTMREVTGDGLIRQFSEREVGLVSCLSFEERSLVVPKLLVGTAFRRWLCIVNEDIETDITEALDRAAGLAARAGIAIEFLNASKRDPVVLADSMVLAASTVVDDLSWIADITTMTHEMIFVIVAAADEIVKPWTDLQLVYNIAAQYSGDDERTPCGSVEGFVRFVPSSATPEAGLQGSRQLWWRFRVSTWIDAPAR